jgi:hypothetical protein
MAIVWRSLSICIPMTSDNHQCDHQRVTAPLDRYKCFFPIVVNSSRVPRLFCVSVPKKEARVR